MPEIGTEQMIKWTGGEWSLTPTMPIRGVSHDTRSIRSGEVYVAIAGKNFDGHRFVDEAFEKGAAAAIVKKDYHSDTLWPLLRVESTTNALCDLAAGYRTTLSGRICAVTGSVGKTSVKEMLAAILRRTAPIAATKGNWNNCIGLPLSLLQMESDDAYGVFEVAMNRPGEIEQLCAVLAPDCGIMTTVGLAHAAQFDCEEAIAREKAAMLAALPESGFAVLSNDEKWFDLFRETCCARVVTVALAGDADYVARADAGGIANIQGPDGNCGIRLSVYGEYWCRNATLVCAAARQLGVPFSEIKTALEGFAQLPLRGEEEEIEGIRFINDAYNANPLSMKASIQAVSDQECAGKRWFVLGEMHELGDVADDAHRQVGEFAAARGDWILTLGCKGRMIADGAIEAGFDSNRVFVCGTAAEVAGIIQSHGADGDSVLLKGSRAERLEDILNEFKILTGKG